MNLRKMAAGQAPNRPAPGTWKLPPGQALTLRPREPGLLEVVYGEIWATFDGPHSGHLNDWGDRVVRAGERLWLGAGQNLVVESWRNDAPAFFSWDPAQLPAAAQRPTVAGVSCARP